MATKDAKTLVRQYVESVWNRGDLAAFEELATPDFSYQLGGQPARDRAGMRQFIAMVRAAFPDWWVEIADIVAEGEMVAIRWQGQVTHEGNFYGIPPTGKRVTASGINIYRIAGGKIAAEWEQMDSLGLLQQLGVLPSGQK